MDRDGLTLIAMRRALICLCLAVAAVAAGAEPETVIWRSDWKDAFAAAKEQHRLVLVDYYAEWCKPCHQMEATVFQAPEVLRRLSDFVLLRVDVDRSAIPLAHRVDAMPTYIIFDPEERERVRMVGAKSFDAFYDAMAQVRLSAPAFLRAAELLDAKKDVAANLLVGNTYSHLGLTDQARTAYQQARKAALQTGDKNPAQLAEALSAFTFVRDDDPARAITLLQKLAAKPTSPENESLIWLSIGNAYRAALDPKPAVEAFQHAASVAPADSAAQREANAAKAAAIAAQEDPIESELRRLQGKWVPVHLETDGKAIEGRKAGPTVTIRFSRWIEKSAMGESSSAFSIDPSTNPKHIDLMYQFNQGTVSLSGIYVLDGDTLRISIPFPFAGHTEGLKKRPAIFATRPGDDFVVTTYQRAPSPK
jgi:uncharacterized protein (TIGR03067 family)